MRKIPVPFPTVLLSAFLVILLLLPISSASAADAAIAPVLSGVQGPVAIQAAPDGSGRIFILERSGRILDYKGAARPEVVLDIQDRVSCCGERGLLGIAFHPDFGENGEFFINYTNLVSDTVVARYRLSADPLVADPGSEEVVLSIEQPFANHNGGQLAFGPDGYLYIGTGDGGGAGDPENNAQNGQSLLGKILRLDIDSARPYGIPPDNPFVNDSAVRDEIWALGLRNAYRFSFDRITGELLIADVGQNAIEELNLQPADTGGQNYGWPRLEGSQCFNPASGCNPAAFTPPVLEYANAGQRCSIIGGYRYRGSALPGLQGRYIYGDFCSGEIFYAGAAGSQQWETELLLDTELMISSFGEDNQGELFVTDLDGGIYRLMPLLSLSPASGSYLQSQSIDLSLILRAENSNIDAYTAELNGMDVSEVLAECSTPGALTAGGSSLRCAGISLHVLAPGDHTLTVEVQLDDGRTLSDSVHWHILETAEYMP